MSDKKDSERDWVLCFEQWQGARFHVRRAGPRLGPTLCGMRPDPTAMGMIRFEDELDDEQMCKTCRKRGIALGEAEETERYF